MSDLHARLVLGTSIGFGLLRTLSPFGRERIGQGREPGSRPAEGLGGERGGVDRLDSCLDQVGADEIALHVRVRLARDVDGARMEVIYLLGVDEARLLRCLRAFY